MISHELKLGEIKKEGDQADQGSTWLFIVETDSYVGNFVDAMGGYITGYQANENASGFARMAQHEDKKFCHGLLDDITKFFSEYGPSPFGCTNGRHCHLGGLAIAFDVKPSKEAMEGMWKRAKRYLYTNFPEAWYANKPTTLYGYTLIEHQATNVCHNVFDLPS